MPSTPTAASVANETRISVFSTTLGWFATAVCEDRLVAVKIGYRTAPQARKALLELIDVNFSDIVEVEGLVRRFREYADGNPDDFRDIVIDLRAETEFRRRVLMACRQIPYGQTRSYSDLAKQAGSPRAARAVGSAMACNRIPIVIPCHRVVGQRGHLGGFSAPGGLDTKRRLLRLEGSL